jgi:DNA-binding transcriptional MerR regulator
VRIKEFADLAGSTVRTVRYYHQIGLLPVPPTRDGARDYDMSHLARLARVRWLAQAGVPLNGIAAMLAGTSVLTDLKATVDALDEQIAGLRAQRERMTAMIAAAEPGGRLSPLPPAIARFYDELEERSGGPARREIRRERDFMELAFYRGDMPAEAVRYYEALTSASLNRSLDAFQALVERPEKLGDAEIRRIAADATERLTDIYAAVKGIDIEVARRAADLYIRLAEPRRRPVCRLIADALLTALETGRPPVIS